MGRLILVISLILASAAFSAPFQNVLPGSIPLTYEKQAASDLVYDGKVLLPDEARKLYEAGKIKDLSLLEPISDSVVWRNEFPKAPFAFLDEMGLAAQGEEVQFVSDTEVPVGRRGFIVMKNFADGTNRSYQILLDVKAHNVLLRKALLRRLGYQIPATQYLKTLRVKFKGAFSKSEFVKSIKNKTFLEPERWVVQGADDEGDTVEIQDVVAIDGSNDAIYNLARGDMNASVIQGRRLFNSLLIPYNLTDVSESVNVFPWFPGRIVNKQLVLDYEDAEEFSTSFEDARWIARRMLKLSRLEWADIVQEGQFPDDVAPLVLEKLLARRNFLREKLNLTSESTEFAVDDKISFGSRLVKGKLIGESWVGYATHFAGIDPDAPLSNGEIWGLVKSITLSNLISNAINELNTRYVPRTDLGYKIFDHQLDVAAKQFAEFILTGKFSDVPFGLWTTDYGSGNIIAAREVVAGNYQGAQNTVQLADVVGISVDYGLYIGADGLPTKVTFSGGAKVGLVRTYTHLKPITSIKQALKEPFRNMIVPWLKSNQADPLDEILKLESKKDKLTPDKYKELVKAQLDEFTKVLRVGESLIVQTSFGPNVMFQVGYGLGKDLQAYLAFKDKLAKIARIHIYRKDDKTIQIYRDPAFYNMLSIDLGLSTKIQLLELGWDWIHGKAKTEFFSLNLDPDLETNPDFMMNVHAVSRALKRSRVDAARAAQKPWLIEHDFDEKDSHFDFLFWRSQKTNITDEIEMTHPSGAKKDFIRKVVAKQSGIDYESVTFEALDALLDQYLDKDGNVSLSVNKPSDPANSFKGKSFARQVTLEAEVVKQQKREDLDFSSMYLALDYKWKGWDISYGKAQDILDGMTLKYGSEVFPKYTLANTNKIQFYNIDLSIALYEEAVQRLLSLNEQQVVALFKAYALYPDRPKQFFDSWILQFKGYQEKISEGIRKGNAKQVADKLAKLVNLIDTTLRYEGLVYSVGGQDKMFIKGQIQGFRIGAEDGDKPAFSHTLGQIGTTNPTGALRSAQRLAGLGEGEMFLWWLLSSY